MAACAVFFFFPPAEYFWIISCAGQFHLKALDEKKQRVEWRSVFWHFQMIFQSKMYSRETSSTSQERLAVLASETVQHEQNQNQQMLVSIKTKRRR